MVLFTLDCWKLRNMTLTADKLQMIPSPTTTRTTVIIVIINIFMQTPMFFAIEKQRTDYRSTVWDPAVRWTIRFLGIFLGSFTPE